MPRLLIDQVADPQALEKAWLQVFCNDLEDGVVSAAGRHFLGYLDRNLGRLGDELLRGTFRWQAPVAVSVPKPAGGMRRLQVPSVRDRIVKSRLVDLLDPWTDLVQSPFS